MSVLRSLRMSSSTLPSTQRYLSTGRVPVSRRAMLYVPGSNPRMLEKSLTSPADCVAYDLEDAVSVNQKAEARRLVSDLLNSDRRPRGEVMVRVNAVGTGLEQADLEAVLPSRHIEALALPKTTTPEHMRYLIAQIEKFAPREKHAGGQRALKVIAMIENARGMMGLKEIIEAGRGYIDGLLFAAEDYCADVGIIRTPNRIEMLYPRSQLVTAAKAYGLQAIDLVCVNYKDEAALREESEEGRRLGFEGKQAIHPAQVEVIHRAFAPSSEDIAKAQRIKETFEESEKQGKGAYGLEGVMIDAPVYKQALKVLSKAAAAGLV
ncbi:Pyruvate/Phosphoenolpyruvate kinase-like domain-containing protein [Papiliotrema laurentii]|uniref:Pyruvate/Phosphoenolpyruvate kinase-like domain-containing protein n=1 Tax=Papiliotrema laurentii TaxID=5418 RepID=A0AAD9FR01_PAPLA|nr:Pyruvate/Phosphoenolpyruvate kinase-like domain-containing protein [Papiliotrema laurentii]